MNTSFDHLAAGADRRWPRYRARLQEFWNQQVRLQQLYIDRHDVSGGDAIEALTIRMWAQSMRSD